MVAPSGTDGAAGVMVIDRSMAAVTSTLAEPVTVPRVAEMTAVPAPSAVTTPFEPAAFETNAMVGMSDDHVTLAVMSAVDMSEYVPMATRRSVPPTASVLDAGVTVIDMSVA